jgi:hypothetical protein
MMERWRAPDEHATPRQDDSAAADALLAMSGMHQQQQQQSGLVTGHGDTHQQVCRRSSGPLYADAASAC